MTPSAAPPRFVPTLTEVVQPPSRSAVDAAGLNESSPHNLEEQMVHRVLQRIDMVLERRLREAVGQIILAHTQALVPHLREEIELVVRESVSQAMAQELPLGERRS